MRDEYELLAQGTVREHDNTVAKTAQDVWALAYKTNRHPTVANQRRSDFGVPHRMARADDGKVSPAAWARQRHQDIAAASAGTSVPELLGGPAVGEDGWSEAHAKEAAFQKEKRTFALLDGLARGNVPIDSVSPRMKKAALLYKQYQGVLSTAYMEMKQQAEARANAVVPLEGARVYVDPTMREDTRKPEFRQVAKKLGLALVDRPAMATIFIVVDVVSPPPLVHWALMLGGGAAETDRNGWWSRGREECEMGVERGGGVRGVD